MLAPRIIALVALACPVLASAQQVIPLWTKGAPGFEARRDEPEQHQDWWYKNIHNPSLTVFLPPAGKANGTAVIVAAGGGHRELVFNPEGVEPAQYLASLGVTAFALKYRLFLEPGSSTPSTTPPKTSAARCAPCAPVRRTGSWIRNESASWAGRRVAKSRRWSPIHPWMAMRNPRDPIERVSARPDFQILIYPGPLGIPDKVPANAPPLFLLGAADDEYVADVMFDLTRKYHAAGAPIETHIYAQGKHAFNMGQRSQYVGIRHWPQRMAEWLEDRGYLRPASK